MGDENKTETAVEEPLNSIGANIDAETTAQLNEMFSLTPAVEETQPASEETEDQTEETETTEEPKETTEEAEETEETEEKAESGWQKRLNREVRKTKEAKEALEAERNRVRELETRIAELETAQPAAPTQANVPLADVQSTDQLQVIADQAEAAMEHADTLLIRLRRNPDSVAEQLKAAKVALKDDQGQEDYSPERMEEFLLGVKRNADRTLRRDVPRRADYLRAQQANEAKAEELFPFWKDRTSEDYSQAMAVIKTVPAIKALPHWKIAVGVYVEGLKALKARRAGIGKPSAQPKTVPSKQPSSPPSAPSRPSARDTALTSRLKRFQETASPNDLAAVLEAQNI